MKKHTLRVLLNAYSEFLGTMPEDETAYEICEKFAEMVVMYQSRLSTEFREVKEISDETI